MYFVGQQDPLDQLAMQGMGGSSGETVRRDKT
jgi:hypothetical protein